MTDRWARRTNSLRHAGPVVVLCGLALPVILAANTALPVGAANTEVVPQPIIRAKPTGRTYETSARFSFTDRWKDVTFQCSLDGSQFSVCGSTKRYRGPLTPGRHSFRVSARSLSGALSSPASYSWTIATQPPPEKPSFPATSGSPTLLLTAKQPSESFSISGSPEGKLYPGAPPLPIPLTLDNLNGAPIYVTGVTVAVTSSPAGCEGAQNLSLTQSSATSATPVLVPAGSSVTLPAQGVSEPAVQLLNLPVNQDACKNATFALRYTGSAHS